MSQLTTTLNEYGKKTRFYMCYSCLMIVIITLFSGFNRLNDPEKEKHTPDPDTNCQNALHSSLGFNAFVRNETHLKGGDTEGPIAIGGNLTMKGIIALAAHTGGENYFNGDSEPSSLVVNGEINYESGEGIHLNHGYVKVGNLNGSNVYDIDRNSASVNTRITSGNYDAKPRIQVQRKQNGGTVGQSNLIDFEAAFEIFKAKAGAWSKLQSNVSINAEYKITLISDQINVLNLTGDELLNLPYMTFENEPDDKTPLVINVDVSSDFEWNVFNMNNIGDQHGRFIIWNFYNASNVVLTGGGTLVGTLFAPEADVVKNSSGNINGQVIANNYYHNQGELHHHPFVPCIDNENPTCSLTVDVGEDVEICGDGEVTLSAVISGESTCTDCTETYEIENTYRCGKDFNYVLWLKDDGNNVVRRFSNVDLKWQEFDNGTATLTGTVVDNDDSQIILEVDVTYSGKTVNTPSGSPKDHFCNTEDSSEWIYYTEVTGTVSQTDGSWSFDISRRGPAFQLGNGANVTEDEVGKYGGSGWFDTTDSEFNRGDFNINIGDCITTQSSEVTYLWSTGETTPTINVTESGTYTVTVADCADCEDADTVTVTFADAPVVNAGDDQLVCLGESAILTVSEGDSYLWSTGETTQTISVTPDVTTDYSVIVSKGNCENTDSVTVSVEELVVNAGDDKAICYGESVELTASDGDSYLWSTGETTQSITVAPVATENYTVTVLKGSCSGSDDVVVSVTRFRASAGEDVEICNDNGNPDAFSFSKLSTIKEPVTLTASEGDSYLWSTGETTQSIVVSPTETTSYTVTITVNGCEASAEVAVIVKDCDGGPTTVAAVYPTLLKPDGDLSVNLSLKKSQFVRISVHNLSGGTVGPIITKNMVAGDVQMNIALSQFSKLSSGVYMINIKGDNGLDMVKRFVID
ncbi:collagen-binding domain-containing protein [Aquimarina sp. AU474]|uniref:collagen-binding domain-containing protein n=1 Tax=Aquimarina sp. AU474 TaxID=2108529 RepID=UPI000D6A044F|nr:collagen-binding domain-containing protein [Aquimarina sp. AU474]